jgi:hypothetical protein
MTLPDAVERLKNRSEVIALLGLAAHRGSLGLFLGTGFSMSATQNRAPSWRALLTQIAAKVGIADPLATPERIAGSSLPEIASGMVFALAEELRGRSEYAAMDDLKRMIVATQQVKEAAATIVAALEPHPDELSALRPLLAEQVCPAWVVTTNYDVLFERIHGRTQTFLPNDVLVATRLRIPVWHIHGTVVVPESVVLTQDDYVETLRPMTYRQLKLAHLLVESTTLMLGYGYGDVNVQTAASIARTPGLLATRPGQRSGDGLIVHAVRSAKPTEDVAWRRGAAIIEIDEVKSLLGSIASAVAELRKSHETVQRILATMKVDPEAVVQAILDKPKNISILTEIARDYPTAYDDFDMMPVLGMLFVKISERARGRGGFEYYETWLEYIFEMLLTWNISQMPPHVFDLLAGQLVKVSFFIDRHLEHRTGTSYAATDRWKADRGKFLDNHELLQALTTYCRRSPDRDHLGQLLADIPKDAS